MRYLVIRTENLAKTYGRRWALNNVSLEVEPGEVFGFLGPIGSGKTTLIRILLDFVRASRGQALVLGMDSRQQGLTLRKYVGYLPDGLSFYNSLNGYQFIGQMARLRPETSLDYVQGMADQFGLDLNKRIGSMTIAEQRELGLIQALMHRPDLAILDEPTRGLNSQAQDVFYRLVSEARSEGRSVFFSSKSLTEMERVCDRVGIIHQGNLLAVERGIHLRARAMRRIELRFANPIQRDVFAGLPNLADLYLEENKLRCTVCGDPDPLIKIASQFKITDFISQQPSLEEVFQSYYGVNGYAG